MADLANLVMKIDSTDVTRGTAALNGLTASGARAEAATVALGGGFKGASAQAAAMAVAAQASARAAIDQAAGFKAASAAASVNTIAMRESLVVARELARGNFTRIPGSLSLLAQGIGSQGGISAFGSAIANQLGLIKQVQNAELAEAAAAAAASAVGVEAAARRAGADILLADTELALAEAQLRIAESSGAVVAAEARIAAAHEAAALAADQARIAEEALARARGLEVKASADSAAATRTTLGTTGAVLIGAAVAAVGLEGAFKALQATVDDSGALDRYAASLVKTKDQLQELSDKVGGFQVTWGDVFHGLSKAASDALGTASIWDSFKEGNKNAFTEALHTAVDWASNIYGVVRGTYQSVIDIWDKFPAAIGDAFYSAVNTAIEALNKLVKFGTDQLNSLLASVNKLPFVHLGSITAPQIGNVANPYAGQGKALSDTLASNIPKFRAQAKAQINSGLNTIYGDITGAAQDRIKGGLPKTRQARAKKEPRNPADDELSKLTAQIAGQNALAQAYLTSDAAVIKAEADQKAMTLAVEKHATAAQTDALKQKELALAIATITTQGAKQISDLNADAAARQKVNALVASGVINASQANQAIQNELALRQQLAALTAAQEDLAVARHAKDQKRIADDIAAILRLQAVITGLPVSQAADEAAKNVTTAQAQISANDNEIAQLQLKIQLIGKSNMEQAVQLALLQEQQQLASIPGATQAQQATLLAQAAEKARLANPSPLDQWKATIPQDAKAITDAIQGIQVHGFDQLASSIAAVVTGTESLGKAFRDVAQSIISDIIQMTVKMLIFRAIGGIFGGGVSAIDPTSLLSTTGGITHFANGGSMIIGGNGGVDNNVLSLNGSPVAMVGQGERLAVFPKGGSAANNNSSGPIEIVIRTAPSADAWAQVDQISATRAGQAVKVSVDHTNNTLRALARPRLGGG